MKRIFSTTHFSTRVAMTLIAGAMMSLGATAAHAHASFVVDATSIPVAGKSYVATLNLGHGCEDELTGTKYDTETVEVDIPSTFTSVRPLDAAWGTAAVEKDVNNNVVKLIWTRTIPAHTEDSHLYRVSFKGTLPIEPLTKLGFVTRQICNGGTLTTAWEGAATPTLKLMSARLPGWNKYTAQTDIDEATIKSFFADALIVWSNNAAYSANPVTAGLITTPLTSIPAGAEFWVKY